MTLAFIGIGNVGFALANNLEQKGYSIIIANDNPDSQSVQKALVQNFNFGVLPLQEAIDTAEVIFLATPFHVNEVLLKGLDFRGKPLVDCTNPVGAGISHGLESKISGSEKIQEWAPTANVVKAYTIYGFENFSNPEYLNAKEQPSMLFAGNTTEAKQKVASIIEASGFYAKDVGALDQALHLEHMTLLWVKMVRRDGHHPNFMWAYLEK
ncbi:NAD(P)-binding domain-containing protein [Winogradskyella sp.]|uniref:NADPH-dependent F420 reductase n=1 Tax=Winogradskyella sp. TaxID=1883156 RepID=UPI00262105AD|nr:NAD(P)-binding domain-containing protein [Winogradskyella sp.]